MNTRIRPPVPGLARAGLHAVLAASFLSLLACEGGGAAGGGSHKVQVGAEQAALLEANGAETLADYGAFRLMRADDRALALLPAEEVERRDDTDSILLNAGPIDTSTEAAAAQRGLTPSPDGTPRLYLVQFVGPIQPAWYDGLAKTGVRVVTYLPNNAYLVYAGGAAFDALQRFATGNPVVQWEGDWLDDYKLDPSARTAEPEAWAIQLVEDPAANEASLARIRSLSGEEPIVQAALGYVNVVAKLAREDLYRVATRPEVVSIQPRFMPRPQDERQDLILARQAIGASRGPGYLAWLTSKGFTQAQFAASGFGVDITDSGIDNGTTVPNHFALYRGGDVTGTSRVAYNRVVGNANPNSTLQGCDGHGTLNAHIVGGFDDLAGGPHTDAAGYNLGLGVAPFVKLGSSVVFDPDTFTEPDYEDLQAMAFRDGMRISTNSWGSNGNIYDAEAQRYDALVRDAQPAGSAVPQPGDQQMVVVFSAGNAGSAANTVGTPGVAKNVLTVGATENVRPFGGPDLCSVADAEANSDSDIASFSSRGPTADGRKKPDLVAPGTHVTGGVAQAAGQRASPPAAALGQAISCFNAGGVCAGVGDNFYPAGQQWYTASSGTSHSTPAVAGAAALLRQHFINRGLPPPSPAMTKAWLMGAARYLTGTGANDNLYSNSQGMGGADLDMAFDGVARQLDDQTSANLFTATGQTRTFTGIVGDPTRPFRVTLAWTDAPGATTGSAWKNDLDLTVTVGGVTYKGNVFTGANSVSGGSADRANNVESVFLPIGTTGSYTVTVTANNINSNGVPSSGQTLSQDFALVVYNSCANAPAAVTGVTATANGDNRIDVAWNENGSDGYNVYRATSAAGPWTKVATASGSPYSDLGVSGGGTWFYLVRAAACAESPDSNVASAVATGACLLPPDFAGLASVSNAATSNCATTLSWSAARPSCGGTLSYSVYRSTDPAFVPGATNRIATGITGTSFADDLNLTNRATYYYVVRATETGGAVNEETNGVVRSAAPTGVVTQGLRYFDDLDGNRPANAAAYWIATTQAGAAGAINLVANCHYQSPVIGWRFGAVSSSCGGTYPASNQATLSLGGNGTVAGINGFSIPANATDAELTFNLWYQFESRFDGAWLAYSTTGPTGPWTSISDAPSSTQPWVAAGGYDNTLSSSPSTRIWTTTSAGANGALKSVRVALGALAGQKVWFAFRFYTDISGNFEGLFLDDVRIRADSVATCTTHVPPPGPAVRFEIAGPTTAVAGVPATFTVRALDAVGLQAQYAGTADLESSDPQAVFPSALPFTAGAATVAVEFRTAGSHSLHLADGPIAAAAHTTVSPGAAADLAFVDDPADGVAGAPLDPVRVGLVDAFGNVAGGTDAVTLSLLGGPAGAALSGTTSATAAGGIATFSGLSIEKAGAGYVLGASASGLTGTTSTPFAIAAAAPAKLAFVAQPMDGAAAGILSPAVAVAILDRFDNRTDATNSVALALGDRPAGATLAGTTTVAAAAGVATFDALQLDLAGGPYTLVASSGGLAGAPSDPFSLVAAAPARLVFLDPPTDVAAGAVIAPAVRVKVLDTWGNTASRPQTPVSISLGNDPAGGALGGTRTATAVEGVATFADLSVDRAGPSYTLVAGASGLQTATSVGFDVLVGPPARLAFVGVPDRIVAGVPFAVQVAVQDAGGNPVPGAAEPIALSLAGGTLQAVATPVNGVATFTDLTVQAAGTAFALEAAQPGLAPISTPLVVRAGTPAALVFREGPHEGTAGAPLDPIRVEFHDAFGNLAVDAADEVVLSLRENAADATLAGVRTAAPLGGVATFSGLSINRAFPGYVIEAKAADLPAVASDPFAIHPAAAASLVFRNTPVTPTAGVLLPPLVVELEDAHGNLITDSTTEVTLVVAGGASLAGDGVVAASGGTATFEGLSFRKAAETTTLIARADGFAPATSAPFLVLPGDPARFEVRLPPSARPGADVEVEATAFDAFDNVANAYYGAAFVTSSDAAATLPLVGHFRAGELVDLHVSFGTAGAQGLTLADETVSTVNGSAELQVSAFAQPTAQVVDPLEGDGVNGEVRIVATGAVDAGTSIGELVILVDGTPIATGNGAALVGVWRTAGLQVGSTHSITARITDASGNVAVSDPVEVVIAKKPRAATESSGCGCAAASAPEAGLWAGLFVAAAGLRRRRRAA